MDIRYKFQFKSDIVEVVKQLLVQSIVKKDDLY